MIVKLDIHPQLTSYDLTKKKFIPGFVGLNNFKRNDYFNVVIQSLAHVKPLRNHFLKVETKTDNVLVDQFELLMRKMWNHFAFKGHVSPHTLLQVK